MKLAAIVMISTVAGAWVIFALSPHEVKTHRLQRRSAEQTQMEAPAHDRRDRSRSRDGDRLDQPGTRPGPDRATRGRGLFHRVSETPGATG